MKANRAFHLIVTREGREPAFLADRGRLDRIEVHGTANVADFSLDTANHPVPLETRFSAIVDGTSGDTYL